MNTSTTTSSYKGFRFPQKIVAPAVWLYHHFPLSFQDVEALVAAPGVNVTHETVRQWCLRFCHTYVNPLRHRRAQWGHKWHLDEVFLWAAKGYAPSSPTMDSVVGWGAGVKVTCCGRV